MRAASMGNRRPGVQAKRKGQRRELSKARTEIEAARDHLERVVAVQPSIERESLLGSAWKRLALVEASLGGRAMNSPPSPACRRRMRKPRHALATVIIPSCSTQR